MSRARLAAAGAVAVLAVTGLALGLLPDAAGPQTAPTVATDRPAVDAPAAPPSAEPSTRRTATTAPPAPSVEEQAAVDVVRAWQVEDPARRDVELRARATEEYAALAVTIDPARVPRAPVDTATVRTEADGQALVDVALQDGTALAVLLQLTPAGQWLAADILPGRDGGA